MWCNKLSRQVFMHQLCQTKLHAQLHRGPWRRQRKRLYHRWLQQTPRSRAWSGKVVAIVRCVVAGSLHCDRADPSSCNPAQQTTVFSHRQHQTVHGGFQHTDSAYCQKRCSLVHPSSLFKYGHPANAHTYRCRVKGRHAKAHRPSQAT